MKFKELVEDSNRVLITSHISLDPDAVCSVLLLGLTLQLNYPDKTIAMVLEETTAQDLTFLAGYEKIKLGPLTDSAKEFRPDLFISVDAAGVKRLSRNDSQTLAQSLHEPYVKQVIIDHHPTDNTVRADLYIRSDAPATAQMIYELLFDELKLKKPEGYANISLLGIVRDSNRFKYTNPQHRKTFQIVSALLDAGASIEELENKLDRYTKDELEVLANLLQNTTLADGHTYSFIDDEFSKSWQQAGKPIDAFKAACDIYSGQFLRSVEGNNWGFVVYPELQASDNSYSVSFRAVSETVDVAAIAAKLGGGGHKQAAGAKNIQVKNVQEAVSKVQQIIDKN